MFIDEANEIERLAFYYRKALWTIFSLVALIGALMTTLVGFPNTLPGQMAGKCLPFLTIGIIIAAAALQTARRRADVDPMGDAVSAMLNDELYRASLNKAYRNALVLVMLLQPVLALVPALTAVENPAAFAACSTLTAALLVTLASLLFYDR